MSKIGIIGAGAAGMMAAVTAAERGLEVSLIEKNDRFGKKLLITGKGRCNVTNNSDIQTHIDNIPTNPRFMYAALNHFTPDDTIAFFEGLGVKLKTERGKRVFPVSDRSSDIVGAFKRKINSLGIETICGRASKIIPGEGGGLSVMCDDGRRFNFDAVLIATGGASYPLTGSTGDGYRLAADTGHTVVPAKPSLVPVVCREKWVRELMGLSLKNVALTVKNDKGDQVYSEQGEMLFTHFGVSGPLVLSASSHMKGLPSKKYSMTIDLKPALDEACLDRRLQSDFAEFKNKDFINSLGELLPSKLIPVIIELSGIDPRKKVNVITKEERAGLLALIKGLTLTAEAFRPIDEAIVTSGGISVKDISPKTMESKLVPRLYFAGEVIDVDGYTGGFNLQIAFSTGALAADSMADALLYC